MSKGKEARLVRVREAFAVLHHHVDSMEFARQSYPRAQAESSETSAYSPFWASQAP